MAAQTPILHLEDDQNDAVIFQLGLSRVGFAGVYQRVVNGQQGVAYLLGEGAYGNRATYPLPGLIVCDLKMPGMDGFEFIRWLRNHPSFAHIVVVTLSSSDQPQDKAAAANLGVSLYLVKSVQVSEIEDQVRTIVSWAQSPIRNPQGFCH